MSSFCFNKILSFSISPIASWARTRLGREGAIFRKRLCFGSGIFKGLICFYLLDSVVKTCHAPIRGECWAPPTWCLFSVPIGPTRHRPPFGRVAFVSNYIHCSQGFDKLSNWLFFGKNHHLLLHCITAGFVFKVLRFIWSFVTRQEIEGWMEA